MIGKQVPVITVEGDNIKFNKNALEEIIKKCGSCPIAIIAVAGDFRKGKSFLLNMFLRFLQNSNLSNRTGTVDGESETC